MNIKSSIVLKVQKVSLETFNPGERANPNWIAKILYEHQNTEKQPLTELEQDIVWMAESIQPNRNKWQISRKEYEIAISSNDIDPKRRRERINANQQHQPKLEKEDLEIIQKLDEKAQELLKLAKKEAERKAKIREEIKPEIEAIKKLLDNN